MIDLARCPIEAVARFSDERLLGRPGKNSLAVDVYEEYCYFCTLEELEPLSFLAFVQEMKLNGLALTKWHGRMWYPNIVIISH